MTTTNHTIPATREVKDGTIISEVTHIGPFIVTYYPKGEKVTVEINDPESALKVTVTEAEAVDVRTK